LLGTGVALHSLLYVSEAQVRRDTASVEIDRALERRMRSGH
jgi:hypothetical protein